MTTITFNTRAKLANMETHLDNMGKVLEQLDTHSDRLYEQGYKAEATVMVDEYNQLHKRYNQLKREFNKMSPVSYDNLKW